MKNTSELPAARPPLRMTDRAILDVLNELEYRQQFLVWYQPLSKWSEEGGVLRLHLFYLTADEAHAVRTDQPLLVTVHRAFKGHNPVIHALPPARFCRRCMKCLWHIEALPQG